MLFLLELLPHLNEETRQLGLDEAAFEHLFLRREPKELAEGAGGFLPLQKRSNILRPPPPEEYLPSICEICEEILKTSQQPVLIEVIAKVVAFLWALCQFLLEEDSKANHPRVYELFTRLPLLFCPLFLHPAQEMRKAAKQFFPRFSLSKQRVGYLVIFFCQILPPLSLSPTN